MPEKGIEDAICAVSLANKKIGREVYRLVVYGQIDQDAKEWFDQLLLRRDEHASWEYGGCIPFGDSTEVLKRSFAMLFPTYYEGEGFAGTLIDTFASGVPVIASDWKYNSEIVKNGVTGFVVKTHSVDEISSALVWAYEHQRDWNKMKINCIAEAEKYKPREAMRILVSAILRQEAWARGLEK